jgi:hypothetical protein
MKSAHAAFFLSVYALAQSAHSQSAEETVMYMVSGYEQKENEYDPNFSIAPDEIDKNAFFIRIRLSPPTGDPYSVDLIRYKFEKLDNCSYDVDVMTRKDMNSKLDSYSELIDRAIVNIDFRKASSISFNDFSGRFVTSFQGVEYECFPKTDDNDCDVVMNALRFPFFNFGDQGRIRNAFAYFRANYCEGSAF